MRSNSKRKELIAAASFIVEHDGMEKFTLEAVAKKAGVSKGGLLHHFKNKESLIKSMVDEYSDSFLNDVRKRVSETPESIGKWHRAYLDSTVRDTETVNRLVTAYVASLYTDPIFLDKLRNDYQELHNEMEKDGLDAVDSTIIRLAIEGLWYSEIYNVGKLEEKIKRNVVARITKMIDSSISNN
ncbi:TetR/AcrR family transcriptional regulator [Paenibacillus sp. SI8]|uniref:TetR/AcrR family transcriptional regulator n=1 Tax=unclassified Paenibacillus TaxID=185978 RepID=UPI003465E5F7